MAHLPMAAQALVTGEVLGFAAIRMNLFDGQKWFDLYEANEEFRARDRFKKSSFC